MGYTRCNWDYCKLTLPKYRKRCVEHRDMKWHEEYIEHIEHLCWEEEELPLSEFEDALDIINDARKAGGPRKAAERLEAEHGLNPTIFSPRFESKALSG